MVWVVVGKQLDSNHIGVEWKDKGAKKTLFGVHALASFLFDGNTFTHVLKTMLLSNTYVYEFA